MSNFFHTICSLENLKEAYASTKDRAPGDDGVTRSEYAIGLDRRLERLQEALLGSTYRHGPLLRRYLSKTDGSRRPIGLARFEDKLVQQAILRVLAPRIESRFAETSFMRAGLGRRAACDYVYAQLFETGFDHWLRLDIADCYGSLRQADLLDWLDLHVAESSEVLEILAQVIHVRVIEDGVEQPPRIRGIEQGMPMSALMANLYLHEGLDTVLQQSETDLDVVYARYMDDILVGAAEEADIVRAEDAIRDALADCGLQLKSEKREVITLEQAGDGFSFLGERFERIDLARGTAWRRMAA